MIRPLAISGLCLALLCTGGDAKVQTKTKPSSSGVRSSAPSPQELWVIPHDALSPAEAVLAQSLQGITGRQRPSIWLRAGGMSRVLEEEMRREGVRIRETGSVWELLRAFRPKVKGMVIYRLGTPSLNVATSLSGVMDAVAVDETLREAAEKEGLKPLADVRDRDEREAFRRYRNRFARGVIVEQPVSKPKHLRDFAVMQRAFTFSTTDSETRTEYARAFGPEALAYGWGNDEHAWVRDLSRANATGAPADWCVNLSAISKLPAGPLRRPRRLTPETEDGVRYVAFVMSDGDNLQWLTGGFVDHRFYWGSPRRGTFPFTWEVSALLGEKGPRVLRQFYSTAKETEGFVAGPGVPGYTFPHFQPDPNALAKQARPYLRKSDLSIVSVLNANEGKMSDTAPILALPEVEGVIYKSYSPYHREKGAIYWHAGKPCVSYKFLLWAGLMEPEGIAKGVAAMPADPRNDEGSYALVNVHAWSYGDSGGPMEAVARTIRMLPPNTRVITADQMIGMLRKNFSRRQRKEERLGNGEPKAVKQNVNREGGDR
ncbi:MAG: hypothetical protein KY468_04530 [Armatimonadetes bacterium]|nr:hypothetical protein [Armatimonadota bacterium]